NIYLSTDGGVNWSTGQIEADSGEISAINDIHFTDEENGWFCSNTSVYHSDDGGNNWHCKATLPDSSLSRIYFKKDEGWVMGEKAIYYSSDGGESWEEQFQIDENDKLVSLSFVNRSNGWALSENGNVYRYGIE
nr:YCF48-related protein [Candidatus Neomarinimicrobiota bacterium]